MTMCLPQEATLLVERQMIAGEVLPLDCGVVGAFSTRSPAKTTPNEDAAVILPVNEQAAVLAVADGVGGEAAGEHASRIALEALVESIAQAAGADSLRTSIINGFETANQRVQQLCLGAATTLAVVEVQGSLVRPYHAGDSMIVIVGQRGKVKLQTVSHSPVGYAIEAGLLDENAAMHHEDRHVVSNVIGMPEMRIEIGPTIAMAQRDTLIIASDGLFDNLTTEEIIQRIRKGPLKRVLKTVSEDAVARMQTPAPGQASKPDDLTFLLFRRGRGKGFSQ